MFYMEILKINLKTKISKKISAKLGINFLWVGIDMFNCSLARYFLVYTGTFLFTFLYLF